MTVATRPEWKPSTIDGIFTISNRHFTDRPNLLLLHGALGDSARLTPLVAGLHGVNLALCDLRGHGRSQAASAGYDLRTLAHDLLGPVDAIFGDEPIAVFGESLGGLVGLSLAQQRPSVSTVILCDTPFDMRRVAPSHAALMTAYRTQPERRPVLRSLCRDVFGLDVVSGTVVDRRHHALAFRCPARIVMMTGERKATRDPGAVEPGAYFDSTEHAALAIGMTDVLGVHTIAGGGHRLSMTHPAELARLILDELADVSEAAGPQAIVAKSAVSEAAAEPAAP